MAYTTFTTSVVAPASGAFAFIKSFHDALLAVGLTQTADTGQLDLSTAGPTRSGTTNFSYGYTVYRLPSVSGLNDIFIRINHTNNADSTPVGYLPRITVGTSTDGAGAINANSTGEIFFATTAVGTTSGTSTHYVALTDGDLSIAFAPTEQSIGISQTYALARFRNLDGTKKNGYWFTYNGAQGINTMRDYIYNPLRTTIATVIYNNSVLTAARTDFPIIAPYLWFADSTLLNIGDDIPVFPPTVLTPEATTALPVLWATNNVSVGNTFTTDRFGTSRTYLRVYGYPHNINFSFNIVLE
jgi:hypothetical protein